MSGRIITFYSYKGGVGRSMALANVAWIMASNGLRVLVVDWDLEAPGIHHYFRPFLRDRGPALEPGLIDYFVEAAAGAASGRTVGQDDVLGYANSLDWEFSSGGAVDLIGAGRRDPSYALRVNGFSWQSFLERLGGHELLLRMKDDWAQEYDYVLIDSRSGIGDIAGICTIMIPDALVVCFALSGQGLEGSSAIAQSVATARAANPLEIFPVPMRVDYGEKELLERARKACRSKFEPLLRDRMPPDYWSRVEVPYVPFYAYNEMLAAFADAPFATGSVLGAAENLTGYLTRGTATRTAEMPPDFVHKVRQAYEFGGSAL
jgi:MinD-like ATPase involved in chromosome partitioning or flagellar assembly